MEQLSAEQRELVSSLAQRLGAIRGVRAVALAGSYARGCAQPGSDIDFGIFYSEAAPFLIQSIRELAEVVNDTERKPVENTNNRYAANDKPDYTRMRNHQWREQSHHF